MNVFALCAADATTQPAGHGVCSRIYGTGGQDRCGLVSVLQGGANARDAGVAGGSSPASVCLQRAPAGPGAAMKCSVENRRPNAAALQRCWARPWAPYWEHPANRAPCVRAGHFARGLCAFVRSVTAQMPLVLGHNARSQSGSSLQTPLA